MRVFIILLVVLSGWSSVANAQDRSGTASEPEQATEAPSMHEPSLDAPSVEAPATPVDLSVGWPSSATPPGPSVGPTRVHHEDVGQIVLGATFFGIGYAGAIAWSSFVFAALPLGNLGCNDTYAGVNLIPVVGAPVAIGVASGCVSLRAEEILLPIATGLFQLAGALWLLFGILGNEAIEYRGPDVALAIDGQGAHAQLSGGF